MAFGSVEYVVRVIAVSASSARLPRFDLGLHLFPIVLEYSGVIGLRSVDQGEGAAFGARRID